MALESTLVQRLQELRKWQVDQQERLLKLQQDQRKSLTIEQKRMYEVFSQSVQDYVDNGHFDGQEAELQILQAAVDTKNMQIRPDKLQKTNFPSNSDDFCQLAAELELKRHEITPSDVQIECLDSNNTSESLEIEETPKRFRRESLNDFKLSVSGTSTEKMAIDEIPVPSSKKDFSSLLEEQLINPDNISCDVNHDSKVPRPVKKPFLRKGAGLARFRMNPTAQYTKIRAKSSLGITQVDKSEESSRKRLKPAPNTNKNSQKIRPVAKVAEKSLDLRDFHKAPVKIEVVDESDLDSSKLETKIFELLEEKADNSSFCSTSSAVMAFMHQSTPTKLQSIFKNLGTAPNIRQKNATASLAYITEVPAQSQSQSDNFETISPVENNPDRANITLVSSSSSRVSSDSSEDDGDGVKSREDVVGSKSEGLHVRFSNFDEYKTYGLTDTSMSTESQETFYADQSNSEESDAETLAENSVNMYPESRQSSEEQEDIVQPSNSNSDEIFDDLAEDIQEVLSLNSVEEDSEDVPHAVFSSELLKERLLELEKEINIFRKQNAALSQQRQRIHEEQRREQREMKVKMKDLELERAAMEQSLREERARLSREKTALETRLRDARERSLQTKQERLEVAELRRQLEQVQADMAERESRAQAAQARQRSQIRVLQLENLKLKRELEQLRENRTVAKPRKQSSTNTRAIHQINQQLTGKIELKNDASDQTSGENGKIAHPLEKTEKPVDKRDFYKNLLEEVSEECENLEPTKPPVILNSENFNTINAAPKRPTEVEVIEHTPQGESPGDIRPLSALKASNSPVKQATYQQFVEKFLSQKLARPEQTPVVSRVPTSFLPREERKSAVGKPPSPVEPLEMPRAHPPKSLPLVSPTKREPITETRSDGKVLREVKHPDGHTEFWYPNGNVKRVYPNRGVTKIIYFNGDVRETTSDNCVKYFYAQTNTWHTTFPDGFEVLEFPDGQQERRTRSGVVEVSFPDGSIRLMQPDGVEKWALPDGTIAETFPNGDKIISLPNGQREVHTSLHKRREFPDGTIKFVYPNGAQETRYSNGRIRMRDEDGNLVMDSYQG